MEVFTSFKQMKTFNMHVCRYSLVCVDVFMHIVHVEVKGQPQGLASGTPLTWNTPFILV